MKWLLMFKLTETVVPGDAHALADGILQLYKLPPEERKQLGANGRAYAEQHHDIKVLGEALARLL